MINISCEGCINTCCGPHLTPILLPEEEKRFEGITKRIDTIRGPIKALAKKENGNCVLLDEKTKRCTTYDKGPLECMLYPFLLDFNKGFPDVKIDKRFCPHLKTLTFNKNQIAALIKKNNFPKDWIEAYKSIENC